MKRACENGTGSDEHVMSLPLPSHPGRMTLCCYRYLAKELRNRSFGHEFECRSGHGSTYTARCCVLCYPVKLTTHLHLIPSLRMCGAIPPLLHTSIRLHSVVLS